MKKLVVVSPTYNEKDNIAELINSVLSQEEKIKKKWSLEILISDSHSLDGTREIVEKLAKKDPRVHLLDVEKRGIGIGLLKGYQYAFTELKADAILQMDSDLQHNPADMEKFVVELDKGFGFVQGSRFITGGANDLQWYRRFFSWSANLVARILMGIMEIHEFTTSFRAFTKEVFAKIDIDKIPWQGKSFIFQPAFLYAAIESGANIKEVPIIFTDRERGYSKMNTAAYIFDLILFSLKVRVKRSKRILKFLVIGGIGLLIDTLLFFSFSLFFNISRVISQQISAEAAIISNFIGNNQWTFSERKARNKKDLLKKFLMFNLTSAIGVLFIRCSAIYLLDSQFGKHPANFFLATLLLLLWNFTVYSKIIWKSKK